MFGFTACWLKACTYRYILQISGGGRLQRQSCRDTSFEVMLITFCAVSSLRPVWSWHFVIMSRHWRWRSS